MIRNYLILNYKKVILLCNPVFKIFKIMLMKRSNLNNYDYDLYKKIININKVETSKFIVVLIIIIHHIFI